MQSKNFQRKCLEWQCEMSLFLFQAKHCTLERHFASFVPINFFLVPPLPSKLSGRKNCIIWLVQLLYVNNTYMWQIASFSLQNISICLRIASLVVFSMANISVSDVMCFISPSACSNADRYYCELTLEIVRLTVMIILQLTADLPLLEGVVGRCLLHKTVANCF